MRDTTSSASPDLIAQGVVVIRGISRRTFLLGSVLSVCYLSLERTSVAVTSYRVAVPQLPPSFEGFTILHLSDLHSKTFGARQADLLRLVSSHRFDIACITGDVIVAGDVRMGPVLQLVEGLGKTPVYFVNGNHEWYQDVRKTLARELSSRGVRVLDNRAEKVLKGGDHLWIVGVDDPINGHARLEQAVNATRDGAPRILLAHAPNIFPAASEEGIDLLLAGHTHGGQIRLPIAGAVYVSRLGFFPHWSYGFFRNGGTGMVVNGGLGETTVPVRVNIRPEVVSITLVSKGGDVPESDRVADVMKPVKKEIKRYLQRRKEEATAL